MRIIYEYNPQKVNTREFTPGESATIEKIACFLERDENWARLQRLMLWSSPEGNHAEGLRELLSQALKEEFV